MLQQDPNKVDTTVATQNGSVVPTSTPVMTPPPTPQTVGGVTATAPAPIPPGPAGAGNVPNPNPTPGMTQLKKAGQDIAAAGQKENEAYYKQLGIKNPFEGISATAPTKETVNIGGEVPPPAIPNANPTAATPTGMDVGTMQKENEQKATATPTGSDLAKNMGIVGKYASADANTKKLAEDTYKLIDPTNSLSAAAKQDILDAVASGNEQAITNIASVYARDYQNTQEFIQAYRTTRDATLKQDYQSSAYQRQADQAKQQYDTAIQQQMDRVSATANNMGIMQDTAGRLQSQNMAQAVHSQLLEQQRILNNLYQSKDWALAEIASNAKYATDTLSNAYNDAMANFDKQVQAQIKNLSDTGMAKTAEGLRMAQSAIETAQNQKLQMGYQYAAGLKSAVEMVKLQIAQKKPDDATTKLYNDGYIHNENGDIIYGKDGTAMRYNPMKTVATTSTNNNGDLYIHYTDGSSEIAAGVGKKELGKVVSSHTDASGNVTNILQNADGTYTTQTYNGIDKKEPAKVVSTQVDGEGNVTTILQDPVSGAFSTQTFKGIAKGITEQYVMQPIKDADGNITGYYAINKNNPNDYKTIGTGMTGGGEGSPVDVQSVANYSTSKRGTTNLQCGQLVNDYWKQSTGSAAGMGDSLKSKEDAVLKIGASDKPVVGGLFVSDPLGNNIGHTGIVQEIGADGSITVLEANRSGKTTGEPPVLTTYNSTDGMTFSIAPGQAEKFNPAKEAQYLAYFDEKTKGKLPTGMKAGGPKEQAFLDAANTYRDKLNEAGEGNITYLTAAPAVKSEMPSVISGFDSFDRARAIVDAHRKAGDLDEMLGGYDAYTERQKNKKLGSSFMTEQQRKFSKDFAALDQIFGKELSQYMQAISGATVGDKEVERLQRQIPNLEMSETEFENAFDTYAKSVKNAKNSFLTNYGFKDLNAAKGKILGEKQTKPKEDELGLFND